MKTLSDDRRDVIITSRLPSIFLNQATFVPTFEKLKAFPCVDQHKFHTSVYFIVIHCIVYNGYIVSREGKSLYLNWLNATCAIISNEASVQN